MIPKIKRVKLKAKKKFAAGLQAEAINKFGSGDKEVAGTGARKS
jgi:hypothetical protein